jgi:hypothetical protein
MQSKGICFYSLFQFFLFRGMNCLHVLAANSKENAQAIFACLLEHYSTFPVDIQDGLGNTGEDFFSKRIFY